MKPTAFRKTGMLPPKEATRSFIASQLRGRWEVFKVNYLSNARVSDLIDMGDDQGAILEVDCIPFAEIRNADE